MKLLANGEAKTDGPCPICKTEHRLISEEDKVRFAQIGFTDEEIEAISRDLVARYAHLERGSPEFHVKPSATREARAERKRRSRAAKHTGE